jgi:hypothetical protein
VTVEEFVSNLMHSMPARAALGTLLQVVHNNPAFLGSSWGVVLLALGHLRDASLLPRLMVVDTEADLLPPVVRSDFEARLTAVAHRKLAANQPIKRPSSLLSLQGLGEAFFGAASDGKGDSPRFDARSERWDAGYEGAEDTPERPIPTLSSSSASSSSSGSASLGDDSTPNPDSLLLKELASRRIDVGDYDEQAFATAFDQLRELVAACGVASLVSGTRFLGEASLVKLFDALVACAEAPVHAQAAALQRDRSTSAVRGLSQGQGRRAPLEVVASILSSVCQDLPSPSLPTCAWLEMVLVDTALRNRDRFQLLWPSLEAHYGRTLCGCDAVTYLTERRVVGVLRVAERMVSRDSLSAPLLALLGRLLISPQHASFKSSIPPSAGPNAAMTDRLLVEVSGQVSAGMWRLLTMNVATLPQLDLAQWQVLFDLISMGAASGGYASIKAFEVRSPLFSSLLLSSPLSSSHPSTHHH